MTDELFEIYRNNVRLEMKSWPEKLPKRYYKNPVLQRLANRWYGMIDTGKEVIEFRTVPKRSEVRQYFLPKILHIDSPLEKSTSLEIKIYKLKSFVVRKKIDGRVRQYKQMLYDMALLDFWKEIKQQEVMELI